MSKYIIVHCKHEGCYDYKCVQNKSPVVPIKINTPIIFLFNEEMEAKEFFYTYMNDVDVIDEKCKTDGEDLDHKDNCSCGIVDVDKKDGKPILFYNSKNQIFLLEQKAQAFTVPFDSKMDYENFNSTNKVMLKTRTLEREQKKKYIEIGRRCEECLTDSSADDDYDDGDSEDGIDNISINSIPIPVKVPEPVKIPDPITVSVPEKKTVTSKKTTPKAKKS